MTQDESQEPDVEETLHWYAFNYRQAHTSQAHEMWLELEQFVDRKMKAPQRTWVGLTDEEAQWLYDNCRTPSNLIDMVEAKLKELNT